MRDRAGLAMLGEDREALLQRCLGVDAVQVIEIDPRAPQPPKALGYLRPQRVRLRLGGAVAALRRDQAPGRAGWEGLSDRRLTRAARVDVGGVDHVDARRHRPTHELDVLGRIGQSIGAQADARQRGLADGEDGRRRHDVEAYLRRAEICRR